MLILIFFSFYDLIFFVFGHIILILNAIVLLVKHFTFIYIGRHDNLYSYLCCSLNWKIQYIAIYNIL